MASAYQLMKDRIEDDVFGILINLYEEKACVIEVWSPSRSK